MYKVSDMFVVSWQRQDSSSPIVGKPGIAIYDQQRRRSDCALAQVDQRLYCSQLRGYDILSFYVQISDILLVSVVEHAGFSSTRSETPNVVDRVSRDMAHL